MAEPGSSAVLTGLIISALSQATPLVLAGLGGVISERSGVVNIALEGMMLVGAFVGMWAGQVWGVGAGLCAALAAGGATGLVHVALTQRLRLNQIVSGVALNILALNATTFLLRRLFNQADPPRDARILHPLGGVWFIAAAFVAPFVIHWALYHTRFGLRLRAVGESASSARMAGLDPVAIRVVGVTVSGVLAAGAGAYLSLAHVGRFTDDMISGRGFIALAAVVCGRWTPLGAAAAALAFGAADAMQLRFQGTVALPPEALRSLPYVLTIVAAMALKSKPPADLGSADED